MVNYGKCGLCGFDCDCSKTPLTHNANEVYHAWCYEISVQKDEIKRLKNTLSALKSVLPQEIKDRLKFLDIKNGFWS